MTCPSPALPALNVDTDYIWNINNGEDATGPVNNAEMNIYFLLDTVPNFSPMEMFLYFDPILYSETETDNRVMDFPVYSGVRTISIQGRALQKCCDWSDYTVMVGDEVCEILEEDSDMTQILCTPPIEEPSYDQSGNPYGYPPVTVSNDVNERKLILRYY